ncbi:MAG: hypothetical protein JWR72_3267 [Flavisolibacter sp.]|nr:hypothetical protein [Flavisolibacter sp.]
MMSSVDGRIIPANWGGKEQIKAFLLFTKDAMSLSKARHGWLAG